MESDSEIDLTGLFCPIPVIKTSETLKGMESGRILKIIADDPGVKKDIPAFCDSTGNIFLGQSKENETFTLFVKKK